MSLTAAGSPADSDGDEMPTIKVPVPVERLGVGKEVGLMEHEYLQPVSSSGDVEGQKV